MRTTQNEHISSALPPMRNIDYHRFGVPVIEVTAANAAVSWVWGVGLAGEDGTPPPGTVV
jgi:hypothetical protein